MKKILVFIVIIQLTFTAYSQSKEHIYLNENYQEIGLKEFKKKANSNFYTNATFPNDAAIFHKLRYREYFGKLKSKKKRQLNKLFLNRYGIDTTKIWLLHYKDFLPDVGRMSKKSGFIILDSTGKELSEILSWNQYRKSKLRGNGNRHLKKYVTSYEDYKRIINIEKEYLGNLKNIELLHFYGLNLGYPIKKDGYNWLEDSTGIFQTVFTDGILTYKYIVLHPDGNFYAITHSDSLDKQKEKINFKSFQRAKKQWLKEYNRLN